MLNGKPLERDLADRLGREIRLANDANCLALSEAFDGASTAVDVVFGVILGTGVGGGIVVNGRIVRGRNAIAGEWGHNPLPWSRDDERPGPLCYCGKHGCVETFLSGPGLTNTYGLATGRDVDASAIAVAAENGEQAAIDTLTQYEDRLARALAYVVNVLDPGVIVLGGGLSRIPRLYAEVPPLMRRHVFSSEPDIELVAARHGDSSGVRGAARLWGTRER